MYIRKWIIASIDDTKMCYLFLIIDRQIPTYLHSYIHIYIIHTVKKNRRVRIRKKQFISIMYIINTVVQDKFYM